MASFGKRLRKERNKRKLSLAAVAEATKINPRYLEALERDDFAALPDYVFSKGFVRAYAEFLGQKPKPWVEAYRELVQGAGGASGADPVEGDPVLREMSRILASQGERRLLTSRTIGVGALVLLAAGLSAVGWVFLRPTVDRPDSEALRTLSRQARETRETETAPDPVVAPRSPTPSPVETRAAGPEAPARAPEPEADQPAALSPGAAASRELLAAKPSAAPTRGPVEDTAAADTGIPADDSGASERASTSPVPTADPTPAAPPSHLVVSELGVGTDVVDRRLVGQGDEFEQGGQVYFWTRVLGGKAGDVLRHVWIREGREEGIVELPIGGPHWRTQSRYVLEPDATGSWVVEARAEDGRVLASRSFVCVEPLQ